MDNLDDLFGDGDADGINAAIAASLDTDALFQRIERSHLVGCCQRLAWSKTGSVAYLSADCRKILIRALYRDKKSAKWALSDEAPEAHASEDAFFIHIEWSSSGLDLVAADQFGRLSIFSLSYALNRLQRQSVNLSSSVDDLGQVAGLHWLPMNLASQSRTALILPAIKEGNRWVTNMKLQDVPGVSNPLENKAAFLCLTRRNILKLIYQQPGQPWSEQSLNLGDLTDSGDMVTHAAFCQAPNHLVLVTYDASRRLRLYRLGINWNAAQGDANHHQSINPQLNLQHVELLDRCIPQASERATNAQLSSLHLEPLSPAMDHSAFTVVAIFTSAAPDHGGKYSVISRWELRQAENTLHDGFKNLKSTPAQPSAAKPLMKLNRLDDIVTQKAILALQSSTYHNMFAFAASDGTVEFRSRETMQVIVADGDTNKATSLPQNGFAYTASDCIDISLSPSLTTSVITKPDGSVQLHSAEFLHGWADAKADNDLAQAAIVSLARELGIVTCYQSGFDDLLSMIPFDLDISLRRRFITEIFRTVQRNVDFSLEDQKTQSSRVLKDTLFYRIMSAQLVVSYQSSLLRRDIPAKVAWVLLSLRSINTNIAQTLTMASHPQFNRNETELLISMKGVAKWSLDLMTLIFDDLFSVMRFCKGTFDKGKIHTYVHEKNTAALHLLLNSTSRPLLQMLGNMIRGYFNRCVKAQEKQRNSLRENEELKELEAMGSSELPFNIKSFDQLIAETDGLVREAYKASQASPQQRNMYEQGMLVEAEIPEALSPVLPKLFGEILPRIDSQVDGVGIFCAETAWLGLGEDEEANRKLERSRPYDVLRKSTIPMGAKIRQCRRCGSVIEDAVDGPTWVQNGQKFCICLMHWIAT